MTNNEIQALFEGTYSQAITFPGFWLKYSDLRSKINELISTRSDMPVDVDKKIIELFPDAKFIDSYQPEGSNDIFRAIRIAPNKLTFTKNVKKELDKAIGEIQTTNKEGWKPFAAVGNKINKEHINKMGFIGIRQAIECLWGKRYEFRIGDISKHEAPVQIRDTKSQSQIVEELKKEENEMKLSPAINDSTGYLKQGSYIGEAINKFAYFPKPKDCPTSFGWDAAINNLATNLALQERWYYEESDQQIKPILKNYLSYTFERLQYEDSEEIKIAQKEARRPDLKIMENEKNAIWNTGLVDNIYDPIYAFFKRNDNKNPKVKQPWIFINFGTANSYYQNIITDFPHKPHRAEYFKNPADLYYDCRAQKPTLNWQHFLKDNIERLPIGFIKKSAPQGVQFIEEPDKLPKPQKKAYYEYLAKAIYSDEDWLQFLTTRFKNALDIALSRVAWNYKTAIPVYYVEGHKLSLLLPLALEKKGVIDVALVCEHKVNEKESVNNYVGRTIFTLQMAYNNARLITRPDSDWLMAEMCKNS